MTFPENERVSISMDEHGVAHVRLTRPDKMNALDPEMFERIIQAGPALHAMKGLRAVVLSGDGTSFCAGLDVASFGAEPDRDAPELTERTYGDSNKFQQVATLWRKLPVPVICAIQGVCFGGGMQIASGADIRIAAPDARMAIMELKWGLVPDMGGYALWRGLVRDDILRELVYTNREFSGEDAVHYGLATYLDADPLARALAIAHDIANRNPHAIRAAKRLSNKMMDENTATLLMEESIEQHGIMRSRNQIEAVMAGMAKRAPRFEDV